MPHPSSEDVSVDGDGSVRVWRDAGDKKPSAFDEKTPEDLSTVVVDYRVIRLAGGQLEVAVRDGHQFVVDSGRSRRWMRPARRPVQLSHVSTHVGRPTQVMRRHGSTPLPRL